MQRITTEGWEALKTKGTRDLVKTLASLSELVSLSAEHPVKLRIDFNSCLSAAEFASFMREMPAAVRDRLDFIEDPFRYDAEAWNAARREFNVKLACDKGLTSSEQNETGYDFAVLKPGRRDWRATIDRVPKSTRIVMTSAMDHAIGQSFAAWEAAMAWRELGDRMDLCGLCTEHLFEQDAFFERLHSRGGLLEVDRSGTGLGFDEVIERLPWKEV
jgi:O-succinylbenzoate synthase